MSFLLDTNAVSEWVKPRPDPGVLTWMGQVDERQLFLSLVTLAEMREGIERLPSSARRLRLETWLTGEMVPRFEGHWLGIDMETADLWGRLMARAYGLGRQPEVMDSALAATALRYDLTLVTRNAVDFAGLGVRMFSPWTSA